MSTAERIAPDEPTVTEEVTQETPKVETPTEPELPAKFQGKTAADIAASYLELEKSYGRQGQEIGELRKWTDALISKTTQEKPSQETSENKEEDIDFDLDPVAAAKQIVRKEIANAMKPLQEQAGVTKAESVRNALKENHPGYEQVVESPEFGEWVTASKIRTGLYQKADKELDYEAIDELLSTYKALHPPVQKEEVNREQLLKDASLETGGTGQSSGKVYKRTELIQLQINDPESYQSQMDDIQRAYQEGRVK
jgi:hypothetical protein